MTPSRCALGHVAVQRARRSCRGRAACGTAGRSGSSCARRRSPASGCSARSTSTSLSAFSRVSTGSWNCSTVSIVSVARSTSIDQRVVQVAVGERADRRRHRRREQRGLAARRASATRIFSTSSRKPRSSISSASSSTTKRQSCSTSECARDRGRARGRRCRRRRGRRPRSCACWVRIGAPPKTATTSTPRVRAVGAQRLRHLDAQLARRRQHERLHLVDLGVDVLDHRQPERRRLAGAGLRLADHVAAREQRRDRLLLDRARRLVADIAQGREHGLGQPELLERCHLPLSLLSGRRRRPRRPPAKVRRHAGDRRRIDRLRFREDPVR